MKPGFSAAISIGLAAAAAGASSPAEPAARLTCRNEPAPGRVLCELEIEASAGRLTWADALIVRTPDFARPLRARVGPREASSAGERRLELPLALVATSTGRGELVVVARSVLCRPGARGQGERCSPTAREVRTELEVGVAERDPR
jgi:hypothetical protein